VGPKLAVCAGRRGLKERRAAGFRSRFPAVLFFGLGLSVLLRRSPAAAVCLRPSGCQIIATGTPLGGADSDAALLATGCSTVLHSPQRLVKLSNVAGK
jgi:hypothetical protein